ncbi:MAG: Do family serine endopeptidase, partial [Alphaproteobacteria bacterium]|nr:Do family serine endopeptidase [Alphaproteobacteria bacterium]
MTVVRLAALALALLLAAPALAQRPDPTQSFAPLVRKSAPAVVNIYAKKVVVQRSMPLPFADPLFRRFFGDDFPGFQSAPRQRIENSLGSGVVVRSSGLVVTNNHVIEGADEITVVLADRREFDAKVVVADQRSDLAVLRMDAPPAGLASLELMDSDALEVGDVVLAIGNPFGVGQTVTSGIVSALARTQVGITDFQSFIQTDAAINPGNSGGALVAMDGRLAGINTAIFSKTGGSLGIGFAVPANMVATILRAAESGGKLVRPWLGATTQTVTAELAGAIGIDRPQGVLIGDIHRDGPAARAGLRKGDVVLAVDEREISDAEQLKFRLGTRPVGGMARLALLRGRQRIDAALPLSAPPEDPPRELTQVGGNGPLAGALLGNLSPAFAEELGLDPLQSGVIVVRVQQGSPAATIRLQAGDRLVRLQGQDLASIAEFK